MAQPQTQTVQARKVLVARSALLYATGKTVNGEMQVAARHFVQAGETVDPTTLSDEDRITYLRDGALEWKLVETEAA